MSHPGHATVLCSRTAGVNIITAAATVAVDVTTATVYLVATLMVRLNYLGTAKVGTTRVGTVAVLKAATDVMPMHATLTGASITVTILDTVRFLWATNL